MSIIKQISQDVESEVKIDITSPKNYQSIAIILTIITIIIEGIKLWRNCNKTPDEVKQILGTLQGKKKIHAYVRKNVKGFVLSRVVGFQLVRRLNKLSEEEIKQAFTEVENGASFTEEDFKII